MLLRQLEQSRKRIEEAEKIGEAKEKEKEILEAQKELFISYLEALREIAQKVEEMKPETETKPEINWNEIFGRIYDTMKSKTKEIISEQANEMAKTIKRQRRRIRRGGLFPR